jgi:hypothetical protein
MESAELRAAVQRHYDLWNAQDRAAWMKLFTEDVTFDDPVGVPTKHGRGAVEQSWDRSFRDGRVWRIEVRAMIPAGDEVACVVHNVLNDGEATVDGIEVWKVAPDGRLAAIRAYFEPPGGNILDSYFTSAPDA